MFDRCRILRAEKRFAIEGTVIEKRQLNYQGQK